MAAKIGNIIDALDFVSSDPGQESEAFVSLTSGEVFYRSPYMERGESMPDDVDDISQYIPVPYKTDLGLGARLAVEFVAGRYPGAEDEIRAMFSKRGAFARFKGWADCHNLLEDWLRFEEDAKAAAVRQWCMDNDIDFQD